MLNFRILRRKKIIWITLFSVFGLLTSSLLVASIYASIEYNNTSWSSEAEVVSITTDANTSNSNIEVGSYKVKRNWKNLLLNVKEDITETRSKELCNEDKKRYWSSITCSWEKTKSTLLNQSGNIDAEEIMTISSVSGIVACGNPNRSDYIRYNPKDGKITIKKNDCYKKGWFIWIICKNNNTDVRSINIVRAWHKLSCGYPVVTFGTFMRYVDNSLTPSEVQKNVTKVYAYIKCRVGFTNYKDQAFRCTWNDIEIYSYKPIINVQLGTYKLYFEWNTNPDITTNSITKDAALTSCKATQASDPSVSLVCTWNDVEIYSYVSDHIVSSTITCVFSWATTQESKCSSSDFPEYSCTGINSCTIAVTGTKWSKLAFYLNNDPYNSITTLFSRLDETLVFTLP